MNPLKKGKLVAKNFFRWFWIKFWNVVKKDVPDVRVDLKQKEIKRTGLTISCNVLQKVPSKLEVQCKTGVGAVLARNDPFLVKKITQNKLRFITHSNRILIK